MINKIYAEAFAETLLYLKGIRQEDLDKIPKKFVEFLENDKSNEYKCNFDYTKPLSELNLKKETIGIIDMICLNYWCITKEEKNKFLKILKENEERYQNELNEKYNYDNLFKHRKK